MNRWTLKDCEDSDWVEIVERDRNVRVGGESLVERQQQLIVLLHDNIKRLRKSIEQRDNQIEQLKKENHMLNSRLTDKDPTRRATIDWSQIGINQNDSERASTT
ncbi:hypothetical protein EV360DRAFT_74447 [Lentinula raphanica]|nr:hypothetical protein EV360DRAFT_74447 [Lentinula raphanica]